MWEGLEFVDHSHISPLKLEGGLDELHGGDNIFRRFNFVSSVVVLKTDIQLVEEECFPSLSLLCSGSRAGTGCSAVGHSCLDK